MKRWIKTKIYGGVSIHKGHLKFNFQEDNHSEDVIFLRENVSGTYVDDNVEYVYGYEYNPASRSEDQTMFRKILKGMTKGSSEIYSEEVEEMVENAVLHLDSYHPLSDFAVTVYTEHKHSPSLMDVMDSYFTEYCRNVEVSFGLLKQTYENVEFNTAEAAEAMRKAGYSDRKIEREIAHNVAKFEQLKASGELFKMKRFIPKEVRQGFHNFLKFASDEEQSVYESLQGVDVLIYDDFLTSGATVREIVQYLRSFNNKNRLTVFVLVKQH